MKKLDKKSAVLITTIYAAISFGLIMVFKFFPPLKIVKGRGYMPNYDYLNMTIIIVGVCAILLIGLFIYFIDWKKKD